ncbi:MAG: FumA C-terminus/TtdB family hydratase beta subunit [Oscillospiraceae bacterium]|jgi:fumarate hydratase subunit beta|nr:FumA C-terminus/TtdB family hydratase beta subunit [Oscillospiraceae bacterium]
MSRITLAIPYSKEEAAQVKRGDIVTLSGAIYTARDAAHKKMIAYLNAGQPLPFDIAGQVIYYAGPAPAKPGDVIGPAGPTTSSRMNPYAPRLIRLGIAGIIGKGSVSDEVHTALRETGGLYLQAVGGAAALIARCVKSREVVAFPELGAEAIQKLVVEGFAVVCA